MSRDDRIREEYANPHHGPQGAARDQDNLDFWSKRASDNSELGHRAAGKVHTAPLSVDDDPPKLPSTGRQVELRDTNSRPKVSRSVESLMKEAKSDTNHFGSSYMKSIRRGS